VFLHCFKILCVVADGHLSHYCHVHSKGLTDLPQLSVDVYTTLDNCLRRRCLC